MFAILDVKSTYSFLDGTMSVFDIAKISKELGYQGVAINDLNNLHHVLEFKAAAEKFNIHPLYSLRVIIDDGDKIPYLLYAKNNDGLQALYELSTYLESDKKLDLETLSKYSADLVVVVYGEGGIIEHSKINTQAYLEKYLSYFKDFYIGISNNNSNKWKIDNDNLKALCKSLDIKTVALPKVEFKDYASRDLKRLFVAMKNNLSFYDHQNYVNEKNFFLSIDEIKKYYSPSDIDNTIEIVNKCNVNFKTLAKAVLPTFDNPLGIASSDYLNSLALKGLKLRLNNQVSKIYLERLKYELSVINEMGYADYFLIVYDTVLFARKNNIYVGPGRGSSASSLVAYVLGITHIDPIENGLLFERFLNPQRISLPDIDIDFPDNKRSLIIDYVVSKYGKEHVAQIITFGSFGAKAAIRDVGKSLEVATYHLDNLSRLIPNRPNIKLSEVYKDNFQFKKLIDSDKKLSKLYELALGIEGLVRHSSIHAAGIIMAKKPLIKHLPLKKLNDGTYVSQYSMNYLESLGLNKIDFLGLRNLAIIAEVVEKIPNLDILKISLDDKKTFELLSAQKTAGIFQLESYGMTKLIGDIKPKQFSDIVAAIALFRPGPMENIPSYLNNRKNPQNIKYVHKDLKPILSETYGIIVYQEQIMEIAKVMANFSLAKADILRKAMSDKKLTALKSLREEFITGSLKAGYHKKTAENVYNLIEKFADYGFNKAHSSAYSLIAYQMAYLKANYEKEFYLALLNGVIGSAKKTSEYKLEAERSKIEFAGININISNSKYVVKNNKIYMPLVLIKGVGSVIAKKIVLERDKGLFNDFFDFVARMNLIGVNKNLVTALIYGGALDGFELNKTTMIEMLDQAFMYANLVLVDSEEPSLDFDIVSKPQIIKYASDRFSELEKEREYLGFYISTHPIKQYKVDNNYRGDSINQVIKKRRTNNLLVFIKNIRTHRTKYGDMMAFLKVADESAEMDLVLMPNIYKIYENKLKLNMYINVSGRIDRKDSLLVNSLTVVEKGR